MTNIFQPDEPYSVTTVMATDNTAISTMPTPTYDSVNISSSTYDIEIPQPIAASNMVSHLPIESCKYDADSRTLFAFLPPPDTLSYPQTAKENWPDELRLTREELLRAAHHTPQSKVVIVAQRFPHSPIPQQMLDETYSLYIAFARDDTNDAWVRLYQSEKLRDYYFAMYRATKKNPYP